jgi:hypothetical protein
MQRYRAPPRIEAPATGPEGGKLNKAARHGDILQEMDHLVVIAEVAVCDRWRCTRPPGQPPAIGHGGGILEGA